MFVIYFDQIRTIFHFIVICRFILFGRSRKIENNFEEIPELHFCSHNSVIFGYGFIHKSFMIKPDCNEIVIIHEVFFSVNNYNFIKIATIFSLNWAKMLLYFSFIWLQLRYFNSIVVLTVMILWHSIYLPPFSVFPSKQHTQFICIDVIVTNSCYRNVTKAKDQMT